MIVDLSRRKMLLGGAAFLAAPMLVRAASLMQLRGEVLGPQALVSFYDAEAKLVHEAYTPVVEKLANGVKFAQLGYSPGCTQTVVNAVFSFDGHCKDVPILSTRKPWTLTTGDTLMIQNIQLTLD